MKQITVYKGRTNIVPVSVGYDASSDQFTSQIRVDKNPESDLIAEWTVSFATDGTDGELVLTLDNSVTSEIQQAHGYMDIKKVTGGEPFNLFDDVLEVLFKNTVTE